MIKELIDFDDYASAYCSAWVATAIVGTGIITAATTAYSANKAADTQLAATNKASDTQLALGKQSNDLLQKQYDTTREDLSPYRTAGAGALTDLQSRLPFLTTPPPMSQEQLDLQKPLNIDQATLDNLPGYQFAKTQGLKATQNSAAARGLGVSGAALKGAATFATGLADQTYTNQFNLENQNRQNAFGRYQQTWQNQLQGQQSAYDRLMGVVGTGESAAAQTGVLGNKTATSQASTNTATGTGVASNTIGGGNAQAAAINATGAGVSKAFNDVGGYAAYKGLYGGPNGSDSYGGGNPFTDAYGGSKSSPLPGLNSSDYG